MNQASREWLAGMREHVGTARRTPPPAAARSRASVTAAAAAAERMILAAHLATWLQGDVHELLAARRAASTGGDPLPALVVTTSLVGIGVVEAACAGDDRILPFAPDTVMAVTEREYRDWTRLRPDPGHALHVNHWSWVKTHVPARRQAEFAAHPLGPGESYWLHRTGTVGCGRERRSCHLWKWNGATASLLQPFVPEGVGRL